MNASARPAPVQAFASAVVLAPVLGTALAVALAVRDGIGGLELGLFGVMYAATMFGVTAGYHRMLAHRAFRTWDAVRWLLLVAAAMAAQGPPLFWVATHRQHHALSDREGDPHSPQMDSSKWRGFLHAHVSWLLRHTGGDVAAYARDLLKDPLVFRINQQYVAWLAAGVILPAAAGLAITKTPRGALMGFLWGGLVRCFVVHHITWSIGSLCHLFGRRPYQTRDASGNLAWLGPVTFGESHHNNHHAFPSAAAFGLEWWEVDIAAWIIRAMSAVGLAWDVRIPSADARRLARERGWAAIELGMDQRLSAHD